MAKVLNFNEIKKQTMTVILPDEKQTTLKIGTPSKALIGELDVIRAELMAYNGDAPDSDALEKLYTSCAKILSNNTSGKKITKAFLKNIFDVEDVIILYQEYVDFVVSLANSKN